MDVKRYSDIMIDMRKRENNCTVTNAKKQPIHQQHTYLAHLPALPCLYSACKLAAWLIHKDISDTFH